MRNHTQLRYLINPSTPSMRWATLPPNRCAWTRTILPVGRDAQLGASYAGQSKPPLLVLVLGETGRAGNFGINGYERDTTPLLAARPDLISAGNAWACSTSTAASVPCMFSHLGRNGYGRAAPTLKGLMDVLQHAGLAVLWVDNQSGCKGTCDRIPNANTSARKTPNCAPLAATAWTTSCSRAWTSAWQTCPPSSASAALWWCCTRWAATAPLTQALSPRTQVPARMHIQRAAGMRPPAGGERLRQQHRGNRPLSGFSAQLAWKAIQSSATSYDLCSRPWRIAG